MKPHTIRIAQFESKIAWRIFTITPLGAVWSVTGYSLRDAVDMWRHARKRGAW